MHVEWLQWYTLIYSLPAAAAIMVLLASGIGGHGGAHHAGHLGAGHAGVGHALGQAPHGPQVSAHNGHAGHLHHDGSGHVRAGLARQLLGFFGIGRAPLNIVLGSFLLGWGLCGLLATDMLRRSFPTPAGFVLPTMGVAALGALLSARVFGEMAERLMPREESAVLSRADLIGLTGTVVYPVSDTSGRLHVFDPYRTLHVEAARPARAGAVFPKGAAVTVVGIDPDRHYLLVEPAPMMNIE
jgi:membrane protein implicated in regulation of membrane protease activity